MKRSLVLSAVFFLFVLPGVVLGQSAKEAVRALKKLEARVQVGISYRDYSPALGDANFEVNLFLESPEAKKRLQLANSISKVMEYYQSAGIAWQCKFTGGVNETFSLESEFGRTFLATYPEANKDIKEGGALMTFREFTSGSIRIPEHTEIIIDGLVSFIWRKASEELKKAVKLLSEGSR